MNRQQNGKKQQRVVVAMSGGVDSSVAAALMVEQGYDVIGIMLRLWSEDGKEMLNRCCTPEQMDDARHIAGQLGIPFYVLDVKDIFRRTIVQFFLDEHARGRTPNPCVECNREIRFSYLYERAMALDADFLATGHYAQVVECEAGQNPSFELHQGLDQDKDQSYVLHVLGQEQLAHVKFPVGGYTKEEVRLLASRFGLVSAGKSDSMDLCFLSGEDYRAFLARHAPASSTPGPIVTADGRELGRHTGLPHYTIGQRKGLGVTYPEPLFVMAKDVANNALILGTRDQIGHGELFVRRVNWIAGHPPPQPVEARVKIRYRSAPAAATVEPIDDTRARVRFEEPVFGATAGQAAVFYDCNTPRCLGGGLIEDEVNRPAP